MARVTVFTAVANAVAAENAAEKLGEIASKIAAEARASVPRETGEWASGISGGQDGSRGKVRSTDPESFYKEYGTSDTPPHMVLTNTARKYGKYSGMTGR